MTESNVAEIQAILSRVDETLETAKRGLEDVLDTSRVRRMSGLRNLIVFGRSVTFVLQNLRSATVEFDEWYAPHQHAMKSDPLMRFFVDARNKLEKQGKLEIHMSGNFSFKGTDIRKFGRPPIGARGFFIGDTLGGSGWEVQLADGTIEKYYVDLPESIGVVNQHFAELSEMDFPELAGQPIEQLSETFINNLTTLVNEAKKRFLDKQISAPVNSPKPTHLRVVK